MGDRAARPGCSLSPARRGRCLGRAPAHTRWGPRRRPALPHSPWWPGRRRPRPARDERGGREGETRALEPARLTGEAPTSDHGCFPQCPRSESLQAPPPAAALPPLPLLLLPPYRTSSPNPPHLPPSPPPLPPPALPLSSSLLTLLSPPLSSQFPDSLLSPLSSRPTSPPMAPPRLRWPRPASAGSAPLRAARAALGANTPARRPRHPARPAVRGAPRALRVPH